MVSYIGHYRSLAMEGEDRWLETRVALLGERRGRERE